jgi:predicted TIM-barrel enzyme
MDPEAVFGREDPVVGMVHLSALPGAPGYEGDRETIRERARADAAALVDGGCDSLLFENYGDTPYHPESVPAHTVAELTAAVAAVTAEVDRLIDDKIAVARRLDMQALADRPKWQQLRDAGARLFLPYL